jgi:hypothetical protein
MVERESKVKLVFEVDKRGISDVDRDTRKVTKSFDKLKFSATSAVANTRTFFSRLKKEVRETKQEVEDLNFQWEKGTSNLLDMQQAGRRGTGGVGGGFGSGESGNIGGRFGQARGALGQLGVSGGAGQAIGIGQSAFELGQALPELKQGFGELLGSVGKLGVAAGVAAVAVGFAVKEILDAQKEATEQADTFIAAQTQAFDAIAAGSESVDTLTDSIKQNTNARMLERDAIQAQIDKGEDAVNNLSAFERGLFGIGDLLGRTPVEAFNDRLKELNSEITGGEQTLAILAENMDKVAQSSEAASQSLLSAASAEAERIGFIQKASELGVEASKARITAIENEREVILAELQALQASGDTSEEVANRIKALEASMSSLDTETGILTNSLKSGAAAANDAAKEYEKAAQDTIRVQEQTADKIGAANQKYADTLKNIEKSASQSMSDLKQKTKQGFKDLAADFKQENADAFKESQNELLDLRKDAFREEQSAARDNAREFRDLRKESARDEKDAIRQRDVLALADIRERTKEEAEDTQQRIKDERDERGIAFKENLSDFKVNQGRMRIERLRDFKRAQDDLRKNEARSLQDARRARSRQLQQAATSGASTATRDSDC